MEMNEKARKAENALRTLRAEEWEQGNCSVIRAIDDYLIEADAISLALLYDLFHKDAAK